MPGQFIYASVAIRGPMEFGIVKHDQEIIRCDVNVWYQLTEMWSEYPYLSQYHRPRLGKLRQMKHECFRLYRLAAPGTLTMGVLALRYAADACASV